MSVNSSRKLAKRVAEATGSFVQTNLQTALALACNEALDLSALDNLAYFAVDWKGSNLTDIINKNLMDSLKSLENQTKCTDSNWPFEDEGKNRAGLHAAIESSDAASLRAYLFTIIFLYAPYCSRKSYASGVSTLAEYICNSLASLVICTEFYALMFAPGEQEQGIAAMAPSMKNETFTVDGCAVRGAISNSVVGGANKDTDAKNKDSKLTDLIISSLSKSYRAAKNAFFGFLSPVGTSEHMSLQLGDKLLHQFMYQDVAVAEETSNGQDSDDNDKSASRSPMSPNSGAKTINQRCLARILQIQQTHNLNGCSLVRSTSISASHFVALVNPADGFESVVKVDVGVLRRLGKAAIEIVKQKYSLMCRNMCQDAANRFCVASCGKSLFELRIDIRGVFGVLADQAALADPKFILFKYDGPSLEVGPCGTMAAEMSTCVERLKAFDNAVQTYRTEVSSQFPAAHLFCKLTFCDQNQCVTSAGAAIDMLNKSQIRANTVNCGLWFPAFSTADFESRAFPGVVTTIRQLN